MSKNLEDQDVGGSLGLQSGLQKVSEMKAKIKYLESHPRSGVLRFRRPYPPHLRPYIRGSTQLVRSIGARKITKPGAMDQYNAALADYDRVVGRAEAGIRQLRPSSRSRDCVLGGLFAKDQAEWIERGRLDSDAAQFADRVLARKGKGAGAPYRQIRRRPWNVAAKAVSLNRSIQAGHEHSRASVPDKNV
jgi:hypothetical protein